MKREPFNVRLRAAMKIKNKKQYELADETNISKSMISEYLSGKYMPKQDNIYKIAKALDVHESWLLGYDIPMNPDDRFNTELDNDKINNFLMTVMMDDLSSMNKKNSETALLYRSIYKGLRTLNSNGVRKVLDYIDDLNLTDVYLEKNNI